MAPPQTQRANNVDSFYSSSTCKIQQEWLSYAISGWIDAPGPEQLSKPKISLIEVRNRQSRKCRY
jgi:hypothetical protein